jgi:hypothetical protein
MVREIFLLILAQIPVKVVSQRVATLLLVAIVTIVAETEKVVTEVETAEAVQVQVQEEERDNY